MKLYSPNVSLKSALHSILGLPISILAFACVSTEKTPPAPDNPPEPTQITLEQGAVQKGEGQLPDLTPIYVRIFAGERQVEHRLAYRAWDINKDGSIDMLEYLDARGQVIRRSYDLNADGVVDREEP